MRRCAVVIGVDKTGDLPTLSAAATGAQKFATWATDQGIDVTLLTDANGSAVSLGDVKNAVRAYVRTQTFEQLILFFAGHGILRAPDYELWLLSGAPDDPNDAVNVPGSIWLARNARIPHIVFVSDACRSRPNTSKLSQIQGGLVFPNESPTTPRPALDVFYGTLPGDPALEVPPDKAVANHRGIFTQCLLNGLKGIAPNLIVDIGHKHLNETKWVIPSWMLKPYLEQQVPEVASGVHISLQQNPDIRVESHPPRFLAEFPIFPIVSTTAPLTPAAPSVSSIAIPSMFPHTDKPRRNRVVRSLQDDKFHQGTMSDGSLTKGEKTQATESDMGLAINYLASVQGRKSFETRTGFSVFGAEVERAVVTGSHCDLFLEAGVQSIRVWDDDKAQSSRTALIQFRSGTGLPLAVIPGFIGTVVVQEGQVLTVNYVPSSGTDQYANYRVAIREIENRKAFAAVAARNGSLRFDTSMEAHAAGYHMRKFKSFDPTLGLYSAYAYAQAGQFDEVVSVYDLMAQEQKTVLFDVAMLASGLTHSSTPHVPLSKAAPFCPMLTQGWAFLDADHHLLPQKVRAASNRLIPGLWTTFDREATIDLVQAIENGELK